MTRFLASALQAAEPGFSQSIARLERAAGNPSADIRLTEEVARRTREKIAQLGLDPEDTTGEELYMALQQKLKSDETYVREQLNIAALDDPDAVISKTQKFLSTHLRGVQSFALKASVARRLFKNKPPKNAMKHLGYRSADSMIKHESPAHLFVAAAAESAAWHRAFCDQYVKLTPSDFEQRSVQVFTLPAKRWHSLASSYAQVTRHSVLPVKQVGAIAFLPVEEDSEGLALTLLLMALEEVNVLRSYSSFVKLQQVKPDFGRIVRDEAAGEAIMAMRLAGQPVSWRLIQRYYASHPDAYHPEIFEPHVQPDDLSWQHPQDVLAEHLPRLSFWQGTSALGLLHEGQPVSISMCDTALNLCNRLPFGQRVSRFFRDNIVDELMLRYLDQDNLEAALHRQLSGSLGDPEAV